MHNFNFFIAIRVPLVTFYILNEQKQSNLSFETCSTLIVGLQEAHVGCSLHQNCNLVTLRPFNEVVLLIFIFAFCQFQNYIKNMGACVCTLNNTNKKCQQKQITANDQNQIRKQISEIGEQIYADLKTLTLVKSLSTKKYSNGKDKAHSDNIQELNLQNLSSIRSNKDGTLTLTLTMPQKSLSQYSNSLVQNNIEMEENFKKSDSDIQIQQPQINAKIQKQTAKHRNWIFNQSPLLNKGLRQEDNALIQRTLNIDTPIKLQTIELKVGVTYYGEWQNAMRHGHGIQIWEEGSRFQGEWEYNQMNGEGKLIYWNGDIYQGQWKDDLFHGKGKYTIQNGHYYEGQWYQGKKQGKGYQIWEDGQTYTGQFKDDQKYGRGIIHFKDGGSYYQGEFLKNQIHGRGKYLWVNSKQYDGEWSHNKMNGFGILKWVDGRYYKGNFLNDKKHGKGEMYFIDGTRYSGNWKNGKQDGQGQIYEGAKLKCVGEWKNGKKVRKNPKKSNSSTYSK